MKRQKKRTVPTAERPLRFNHNADVVEVKKNNLQTGLVARDAHTHTHTQIPPLDSSVGRSAVTHSGKRRLEKKKSEKKSAAQPGNDALNKPFETLWSVI